MVQQARGDQSDDCPKEEKEASGFLIQRQ